MQLLDCINQGLAYTNKTNQHKALFNLRDGNEALSRSCNSTVIVFDRSTKTQSTVHVASVLNRFLSQLLTTLQVGV